MSKPTEKKPKTNDPRSADIVGFFLSLEFVLAVVVGVVLWVLRAFDVI